MRWQVVTRIRDHFWQRWQADYLFTLQQGFRWSRPARDFQVDDLVVIKEDGLPEGQWRLGHVVHTHSGRDGHVRVVTV